MTVLLNRSNVADSVEREIDSFLGNVKFAAHTHKHYLRLRGLEADARTAYLLENVSTTINGDCELLFAVMLLQKFATELQLFARPLKGTGGQTRCFHVTRLMRAQAQPGQLPDLRHSIKGFVQRITRGVDFDELCWGSDLPESTVAAVLNGTHTQLRDLSNVLRAAGFQLHFVLVHEELRKEISDEQMHARFRTRYAGACAGASARHAAPVLLNSWKLLLGDLQ